MVKRTVDVVDTSTLYDLVMDTIHEIFSIGDLFYQKELYIRRLDLIPRISTTINNLEIILDRGIRNDCTPISLCSKISNIIDNLYEKKTDSLHMIFNINFRNDVIKYCN